METNFNFKSQICTDKIQSERLLSLGLKKETADMCHTPFRSKVDGETLEYTEHCSLPHGKDIPAWSLGRLMEITLNETWNEVAFERDVNPYEQMIKGIEWLIKEGYFPKEYLV
jgi:hypothetical protein